MDSTREYERELLTEEERKFKLACRQIEALNKKLDGVHTRYDIARRDEQKSFRYNLRMRLAVVESMRNAYYEYARARAETVKDLRLKLYGQRVEIVAEDR